MDPNEKHFAADMAILAQGQAAFAATAVAIIADALFRRGLLDQSDINQMHVDLLPWEGFAEACGYAPDLEKIAFLRRILPEQSGPLPGLDPQ
jgi:hypothetical protein